MFERCCVHHACMLWWPLAITVFFFFPHSFHRYLAAQSIDRKTEAVTGMQRWRQWPSLNHVENFWFYYFSAVRLFASHRADAFGDRASFTAPHYINAFFNLNITLASSSDAAHATHAIIPFMRRVAWPLIYILCNWYAMCNELSRAPCRWFWLYALTCITGH